MMERQRRDFTGIMVAIALLLTVVVAPFPVLADDTAATDAVATAVQAQLPPGYIVTYTQVADIGGDGQVQAIFKARMTGSDPPFVAELVGIAARQGGDWVIREQMSPYGDAGTAADIYVYPRNDRHPGFVITNRHVCGANCNAGDATLLRYEGGAFITALTSFNDRGDLAADPASGAVTLSGPVYTRENARCCPEYRYMRAWAWQGTTLALGDTTFAAAPDKVVPSWLASDGPRLLTSLGGFTSQTPPETPAMSAATFAAILADTVTVRDAANTACTASRSAVAQALARGVTYGGAVVWPATNGYNLALSWSDRAAPSGIAADGCTLDAGNGGGYVLHLARTATGDAGDALYAAPQLATIIPNDAVQLPPL